MNIVIGIPAMDSVSTSFFASIVNQQYMDGHKYSYAIEVGSLVYNARGRIAQRALEMGADYLIFYDSDMVLRPETTVQLIESLEGDMPYPVRERQPKGFVTGLYFNRRLPTRPQIVKSMDWYMDDVLGAQELVETYEGYPRGEVFEVAGCGFGCCIMRTDMLKDMTIRYKGNPFTPMPRLGEDYSFCYRAKRAGYKLFCDSRILPGHAGLHIYNQSDWDRQKENGNNG